MKNAPNFDPFALDEARTRAARAWLIATGVQALSTCALLWGSHLAEGGPFEMHARLIVCLGIVATWSLALRTIRARVLELLDFWRKTSLGLLKKASESGRHFIRAPLNPAHEAYVKGSIRRLRIIAAGLTIPFFVMPLMWAFISAFLFFQKKGLSAEQWASIACFMLFSACVVAGYFHWSIVPLPAPVPARPNRASPWRRRR